MRNETNKRRISKDLSGGERTIGERELAFVFVDLHLAAALKLAENNFVSQAAFDLVLNQPRHRARPKGRVVAFFSEPAPRFYGELQKHFLLVELVIELDNEFIYYPFDNIHAQRIKNNHRVEAVAKFRAEHLFNSFFAFAGIGPCTESQRRTAHLPRAGVGGHD